MNILLNNYFPIVVARINNYFFSGKHGAHPLVALRVGTALILLTQFIHILPDIHTLIGNEGMIRQDLVSIYVPDFVISSSKIVSFLETYFDINETQTFNLLGYTYASSLVLLFFGLGTRINAVICLLLHVAFVNSGHFFSYGADYILNTFLFYCVIFPTGNAYSIDSILFKTRKVVYTPYIRVLQLHLCLIYLIGGLMKSIGINWWNGVSIWKAMNRPNITKYNLEFLSQFSGIFTILGISTIIIELGYLFFINTRKTRRIWLFVTCLMHIGIALVLKLHYFAAVMILFNIVAYHYTPANSRKNLKISIDHLKH